MIKEGIIRMAMEAGVPVLGPERTKAAERFASLVAAAERERICDAIKAEDDHCATGDYMLDSDDCIRVVRGEWTRPDFALIR